MISQYLNIEQNVIASEICKVGALVGPYKMEKLLGKGNFGQVFQAIHTTKKIRIAIKVINVDIFKAKPFQEVKKRLAEDQVIHMQRCDCQHVIKYKGRFANSHIIGILMELCQGGNLMQFIQKREKQTGISEQQAFQIIQQVLYGVNQLHSKNILHRDIKPENILIHNGFYIVSDLGFSKYQCIPLKGTNLGTIQLKAPQIIFSGEYSKSIDMWAVGVTLYRMIYGEYPFPSKYQQLVKVIKKPLEYPQLRLKSKNQIHQIPVSIYMRNFIAMFIEIDPQKRITAQKALNHTIFQTTYSKLSESYIPSILEVSKVQSQLQNQNLQKDSKDLFQDVLRRGKQQRENSNPPKENQQSNKLQQQQYLQARQQHFLGLKSEFIHNIIKRIEQANLIEVSTRKEKQFLLLLASRCWIYMSNFNEYYNKQKNKQNYTQLSQLAQKFQIKGLYKQIKTTFEKYCKLLQEAENSPFEILKDYFRGVFYKNEEQKKKIIIDGIQKMDYVLQEQLDFTNLYIKDIIAESFKPKKYLMKDQIIKILECYKQINLINCQQTYQKNSTFKAEVQKITSLNTCNFISNI